MCYALHAMNLEYESFTFQNKLQNLHNIFCDAPVFINFVKWDQSRLNCFFFNISNVCVYVCVRVCVRVLQVVSALLECNAKLNKKDQYGNTPLILACLKGNLEIATILLEVLYYII